MLVSLIPASSTPLLAAGAGLSQVTSFASLQARFKKALAPLDTYADFFARTKDSLQADGNAPQKTAEHYLDDAWRIFDKDTKFEPQGDPKRLTNNIRGLRGIHKCLLFYRAIREIHHDTVLSEDDQLFVSKIEEIFEQNQTKLREKLEAKITKNRAKLGYPPDPQGSAATRDGLSRIVDGRSKPNKP